MFMMLHTPAGKSDGDEAPNAKRLYKRCVAATAVPEARWCLLARRRRSRRRVTDAVTATEPPRGRRYELSSEKTFSSLFFPGKGELLFLLDHFQKKTGKFGIAGFPHKLGLLLHGPPGTGKTSIIKAIAEYTNRHIVSVPLSKMKTNQELMDVMFDQSFRCVNNAAKSGDDDAEITMQLPFKKVRRARRQRGGARGGAGGLDVASSAASPGAAPASHVPPTCLPRASHVATT